VRNIFFANQSIENLKMGRKYHALSNAKTHLSMSNSRIPNAAYLFSDPPVSGFRGVPPMTNDY